MNRSRPEGLTGFYQLLGDITKISSWVLPTAGISPVIATLIGINPPWPAKVGLTATTSVVVLFTLIMVYHFLYRRRRRTASIVIAVSMVGLILATIVYFIATAALTYQTPVTHENFAKGFTCTPEASSLFKAKCPWLDVDELKGAEYEATRLWTLPSITAVKITLLFAWFVMFGTGATTLGAFVNFQSSRPADARVEADSPRHPPV